MTTKATKSVIDGSTPITPLHQQQLDNKAKAEKSEKEEPASVEVEAKGTHPFNAEKKDGELILKHKITSDDLALNPDLRSLGWKDGDIVPLQVVGDSPSHNIPNSNK